MYSDCEFVTDSLCMINDALTTLQERINATSERLKSIDEKNHRYEALFEDAVTKEDIGYLNLELEKTTEVNNETSNAIKKLQKEINKQKEIFRVIDVFKKQNRLGIIERVLIINFFIFRKNEPFGFLFSDGCNCEDSYFDEFPESFWHDEEDDDDEDDDEYYD